MDSKEREERERNDETKRIGKWKKKSCHKNVKG